MTEVEENIEIWRDVPGYEGSYQISSWGRVKSLPRRLRANTGYYTTKERIFKKYNNRGYEEIKLYNGDDTFKNCQVHRLVAFAFIPNPNNYPHINHIDGNPRNSRVENLEWCTNSMNTKHAYDTGLKDPKNYKGEGNCNAKLTEEQVKLIRYKHEVKNMSVVELTNEYNISYGAIYAIVKRNNWKHV